MAHIIVATDDLHAFMRKDIVSTRGVNNCIGLIIADPATGSGYCAHSLGNCIDPLREALESCIDRFGPAHKLKAYVFGGTFLIPSSPANLGADTEGMLSNAEEHYATHRARIEVQYVLLKAGLTEKQIFLFFSPPETQAEVSYNPAEDRISFKFEDNQTAYPVRSCPVCDHPVFNLDHYCSGCGKELTVPVDTPEKPPRTTDDGKRRPKAGKAKPKVWSKFDYV